MKSLVLKDRVQKTIEVRVSKLLRELGYPSPPLNLENVRYLLELNLGYFQRDDNGILQRLAHKLKVAKHQVAENPGLLVDAVKKMDLRALWVPDKKFIMIDETQPTAKWRWLEAHEMGHKLCDWHGDFLFGDTDHSLSVKCHEKIEAEANYAAGHLLFLGSTFKNTALDLPLGFNSIQSLKKLYQNTLTTTLWRYVEQIGDIKPMVGLISGHPHISKRARDFDVNNPCRYFIQSPAFSQQFANLNEREIFAKVSSYCGAQRAGPLGEDVLELKDLNGDIHLFHFETFFNNYDALTLGWYLKEKALTI